MGDELAVGGGPGGQPVLFKGQAFVAGEAVDAFEVDQIGAGAGAAESGEGLGKACIHGVAAFLRHGVAGDEAGEAGGGGESGVITADGGVAGEEAVLFDEPGTVAGGVAPVLKRQGEAVEKIGRGGGVRLGGAGDAEQGGEKAVGRRKEGEHPVVASVRGLGEKMGFGEVDGAGHGGGGKAENGKSEKRKTEGGGGGEAEGGSGKAKI